MTITTTTNQRFRVNDEWMKATGLSNYYPVFTVRRINDVMPGLVLVELDSHVPWHCGKWIVNADRGEFVSSTYAE